MKFLANFGNFFGHSRLSFVSLVGDKILTENFSKFLQKKSNLKKSILNLNFRLLLVSFRFSLHAARTVLEPFMEVTTVWPYRAC